MNTIIKKTCPLGHKCKDYTKDKDGNIIEQHCSWLMKIDGVNPHTNEKIQQEECAIPLNVMMLNHVNKSTQEVKAETQDFKNEMVTNNKNANNLLLNSINQETLNNNSLNNYSTNKSKFIK